jgi:hypothetical protein
MSGAVVANLTKEEKQKQALEKFKQRNVDSTRLGILLVKSANHSQVQEMGIGLTKFKKALDLG